MSERAQPMGRKQLHLDAIGGVAGDMFIAAVLAAFPALREGMVAAIRAAGLPEDIDIRVEPHRDHALTGLRFSIEEPGHPAAGRHHHRRFSDIRRQLQQAPLEPPVRAAAIEMFTLLAGAEAQVHGMTVDDVGFHELGEWDSIADIVGAAFLICALDASWSVSPLPLGGGRVETAHGPLPVPAPATAKLLEGFECIDDGVGGERVTPTGAVILRQLAASQARKPLPRRLLGDGTGFGMRTLPGMSNVLRVLAFETVLPGGEERDTIAEILFEVDDQTPEDLAIGLTRLRAHPGVRDILQLPAFGKEGRMTTHVRVLADPLQISQVANACFEETATIGLRYQLLERYVLPRETLSLEVEGQRIGVKAVHRGATTTVKAEAADVATLPGGCAARDRLRHRVDAVFRNGETDR